MELHAVTAGDPNELSGREYVCRKVEDARKRAKEIRQEVKFREEKQQFDEQYELYRGGEFGRVADLVRQSTLAYWKREGWNKLINLDQGERTTMGKIL
jgi:hypothetical protein